MRVAASLAHLVGSVRHRGASSWGAALLPIALSWAQPARAAQPVDLTWQAPPGCPQQSAVRDQIRALVPSGVLESGRLKAEGTITRVDKRYRLKLVLHLGDIDGERSIESDSCNDLAGAAAVALGLLLQSATQPTPSKLENGADSSNGTTTGQRDERASTTAPAKPAAPPPTVDEATNPSSPPPYADSPRNWRLFIAPQLAFDVGPMPKPAVGVAVTAGLNVQPWRAAASFTFPRRQTLQLPGATGAGAELEHWAVEAWICRAWRSQSVELAPCLVVGWQKLAASGNGAGVEARTEQASWVSGGAAAVGRWYVAEWFAFAASASLQAQGARPTISIEGLDGQDRLKPLAFGFRTGPLWIF